MSNKECAPTGLVSAGDFLHRTMYYHYVNDLCVDLCVHMWGDVCLGQNSDNVDLYNCRMFEECIAIKMLLVMLFPDMKTHIKVLTAHRIIER